MLQQRGMQLVELPVAERLAQIEPADLGAERPAKRAGSRAALLPWRAIVRDGPGEAAGFC